MHNAYFRKIYKVLETRKDMGLFGLFRAWRLQRKLEKKNTSEISQYVDEYLRRTQKTHAETMATAEKLNKANLMNMQTKKIKDNLMDFLEPDEDEEEETPEEEEGGDYANEFLKGILDKMLNKTAIPQGTNPDMTLEELFSSLSPEQKVALKNKFFN